VPMFPPVFLRTIEAILSARDIGRKSLRVGGVPHAAQRHKRVHARLSTRYV